MTANSRPRDPLKLASAVLIDSDIFIWWISIFVPEQAAKTTMDDISLDYQNEFPLLKYSLRLYNNSKIKWKYTSSGFCSYNLQRIYHNNITMQQTAAFFCFLSLEVVEKVGSAQLNINCYICTVSLVPMWSFSKSFLTMRNEKIARSVGWLCLTVLNLIDKFQMTNFFFFLKIPHNEPNKIPSKNN